MQTDVAYGHAADAKRYQDTCNKTVHIYFEKTCDV
jgi:hypothetical protein